MDPRSLFQHLAHCWKQINRRDKKKQDKGEHKIQYIIAYTKRNVANIHFDIQTRLSGFQGGWEAAAGTCPPPHQPVMVKHLLMPLS